MQLHSSKAIVLRSAYLKEQQKILTLFSEQFGVISLVIQKRAKQAHCLSEPFCEGEFFFWPGSSDLKKYHDGSILDLHLGLRNQLGYLKTASAMAKAISTSQMPEKASLPIYALFSSFLKQIPRFPLQETLLTCFYLKILRYEGLYHKDCEFSDISKQNKELLDKIAYAQNFDALKEDCIPPILFSYVEKFFFEHLHF
ncbi:MAG: DNA repair protein RecO [Rhabdochlamydiaceae bacterium]|nr:DNA repair protein RecO [Rhabdochlamydiaceae bacterium]